MQHQGQAERLATAMRQECLGVRIGRVHRPGAFAGQPLGDDAMSTLDSWLAGLAHH